MVQKEELESLLVAYETNYSFETLSFHFHRNISEMILKIVYKRLHILEMVLKIVYKRLHLLNSSSTIFSLKKHSQEQEIM
uniref:Uncharacterized protein n=1 Tax=Solanum lycopersicum TaxID=4081 RepID=A0A3Q7GA26_SOLLC